MEDGVKRNCVSFRVDDVHKVTLLSHEKSYEIQVSREDQRLKCTKHRLETTPLSSGKETGQVTINDSSSLRTGRGQGKGCGHSVVV